MSLRAALVVLIVAATAAFVVGTTIERNSAHSEKAAATATTSSGETPGEQTTTKAGGEAGDDETQPATSNEAPGAESDAHRAAEATTGTAELKPLGIDVEAVPFVVLAGLTSLALAAAAWLLPRSLALLVVIVVVMLGFAALDVREVAHQSDEGRTGLAVLAAAVAALHLAAAVVAAAMGRDARHTAAPPDVGASIPV